MLAGETSVKTGSNGAGLSCFLGEWGRWASMGATGMGKESPLAELPLLSKICQQ